MTHDGHPVFTMKHRLFCLVLLHFDATMDSATVALGIMGWVNVSPKLLVQKKEEPIGLPSSFAWTPSPKVVDVSRDISSCVTVFGPLQCLAGEAEGQLGVWYGVIAFAVSVKLWGQPISIDSFHRLQPCESAALTNIYYFAHHDNPADLFGCSGQCLCSGDTLGSQYNITSK